MYERMSINIKIMKLYGAFNENNDETMFLNIFIQGSIIYIWS
jgi:hypothetical protein